jgi:hypothetical protein
MNEQILDGLIRTANLKWTPLVESGVDTRGISVKCLRRDQVTGRAPSFLLRFEPGAKVPVSPSSRGRRAVRSCRQLHH